MNVIAIETSGPVGSVAACRDDEVLAEESIEHGMQHGRLLVSLIDGVLKQAAWEKARDIELVAVSRGPGSFTGLRVGLMCARTIAQQLAIPIVGVCSLDALAENAPAEFDHVLAALDARRGDVYASAYERRQGALSPVRAPAVMRPADACRLLPPPLFVIGDAVEKHADVFSTPDCTCALKASWRISAAVIARLGLSAFRRGRRDDPLALEPAYLRRPEAEEKRLAREQGAL